MPNNDVRLYSLCDGNSGKRGEPFPLCDKCKPSYPVPEGSVLCMVASYSGWACSVENHTGLPKRCATPGCPWPALEPYDKCWSNQAGDDPEEAMRLWRIQQAINLERFQESQGKT